MKRFDGVRWSLSAGLFLAVLGVPGRHVEAQRISAVQVVSGVTERGEATELWLSVLRRRLTRAEYDSVAPITRALSAEERAWADLVRSRAAGWQRMTPSLAVLFRPAAPPETVTVVLGNRGAEDAFTHDGRTVGFDLAALQANYGNASEEENADRVDRFFRHEFTHVMQKAWMVSHPWPQDTPVRAALWDIWAEGLGNYRSLSARWLSQDGRRSETAARTLALLEPRFVARLGALACAAPENAAPLLRDLSWGRFDRKWGALPAALWLEEESAPADSALRRFILAGPAGVWELASRHLPAPLAAALAEVRMADSLCAGRVPQAH